MVLFIHVVLTEPESSSEIQTTSVEDHSALADSPAVAVSSEDPSTTIDSAVVDQEQQGSQQEQEAATVTSQVGFKLLQFQVRKIN